MKLMNLMKVDEMEHLIHSLRVEGSYLVARIPLRDRQLLGHERGFCLVVVGERLQQPRPAESSVRMQMP